MVNPHFGYSFTYRLTVPKMAVYGLIYPRLYASGSLPLLQGLIPRRKNFGG